MSKTKTNRNEILYTRVNKKNSQYLAKVCKASKLSKTAFVDMHLNFLRNKFEPKKAAKLIVKEARNKIQGKGKAFTQLAT